MENNLLDFCEFKRRKEEQAEKELRARAIRSALSLTDKYFQEVTTPQNQKDPNEQA